jgi:hypothetical protein
MGDGARNMSCVGLQGGLRQYCIEIKSYAIDVNQISDVDLTLEPIRQEDNVNSNFQLKDDPIDHDKKT